jgi:hypothetical protein
MEISMEYKRGVSLYDKCCSCNTWKKNMIQVEDTEERPAYICIECLEKKDRQQYAAITAAAMLLAVTVIILLTLI